MKSFLADVNRYCIRIQLVRTLSPTLRSLQERKGWILHTPCTGRTPQMPTECSLKISRAVCKALHKGMLHPRICHLKVDVCHVSTATDRKHTFSTDKERASPTCSWSWTARNCAAPRSKRRSLANHSEHLSTSLTDLKHRCSLTIALTDHCPLLPVSLLMFHN